MSLPLTLPQKMKQVDLLKNVGFFMEHKIFIIILIFNKIMELQNILTNIYESFARVQNQSL